MSLWKDGIRLEDLGSIVVLREYCALYREGESKVRYQVKTGTCRVPPAMTRPLRWRKACLTVFEPLGHGRHHARHLPPSRHLHCGADLHRPDLTMSGFRAR